MEDPIFKTTATFFAMTRSVVIRILAIGAVVFSYIKYEENTTFFTIFMIVATGVFLLSGIRQVIITETQIIIKKDSLLKTSIFNSEYNFSELKEVSADEVIEVDVEKGLIGKRYRLVIIPLNKGMKTHRISTSREEMSKVVALSNEMIEKSKTSFKLPY